MTYDPHEVLRLVDNNLVGFMVIGGAAMIFNYAYFISAALAARRDKVFTFPLFCSSIWFAHDLSFVLAYDQWFNGYHHWYVEGFWLGLIPTTLFEAWYIHQTWLYGKNELLPGGSRQGFALYMIAAIVVGIVGWWSFKAFLDDPIYAYTFGSSGFIAPIFVLARMLRRADAKGQSVTVWVSYTGMQVCWFSAAILYFGPAFRDFWYLAMVAVSIGGGMVMATMVRKFRGQQ